MTTNLTETISKKLFVAILMVTFGAEILLYLNRYSYLASTLYDALMVSSFFVGLKLHRHLQPQTIDQRPKRRLMLQFTGGFLIFFLGSYVVNIYSSYTFDDFSMNYEQYVEDYTLTQTSGDYGIEDEAQPTPLWTLIDQVDTIGADIYTDSLAGLEEVWRLSYMILILIVCKKIFSRRWETGRRDIFVMLALFWTSIFFGVDHTLDTVEPWPVKIGAIVTFANMGFLFGIILLWTRNLWVTVLIHSFYDITATLSWYYFDYAVELFGLLVMIIHIIMFSWDKSRQRQLKQQETVDVVAITKEL
ncbi:CPBP family intramembrane glutamic endopeptidase [Neobacillus dielmonensis]|uniref:CPBP family intramembrane glutamic endopeptidase n=1 Tax=Neobacillus dielmonensis TaxID=1347369 RepID=UPI0005A9F5E5|nr:CPBP family intramembrane glutamic endopeptidase [Neobacillus dielmonensis]